ncbi:UNVERIFIED_CONTAM: Pentatricopeptide repeat-containing protein [Sesamum angustifolium]|uniref:Pentatricopeptide repeat-containing protein n=1 Tax=Sesamum angustifolium TaxID=2727405 RepID=A0AAW2IR82_9LAMI
MTTVYSRLNELELARKLFDESPEKTLASWNAMISVTSILSACAQLGALGLGKWVHDLIKLEGIESNIYVSTALIDMYMKCGSIEEARSLFDMMGKECCDLECHDCWLCHAGLVDEGERIFHSIVYDHGFEPNSEHYACMVDILGRAGKLRDAIEFINKMPIEPGPAEWVPY